VSGYVLIPTIAYLEIEMCLYMTIRFHLEDSSLNYITQKYLSLEQVKAACSDPETSSRTCKLPHNVEYTKNHGPWFEGYTTMENGD
jgi:hypothetical protein